MTTIKRQAFWTRKWALQQQDELTRSYSREEWDALTLQQKAEYIEQEKG